MKEFFEKAKDKFSAMPTPIKIFVILGGGLALYFLFFRRAAGTAATTSAAGYDSLLGNIGGGSSGSGGSSDGGQALYNENEKLMNENIGLANQLNEYVKSFNDYAAKSEGILSQAQRTAETAQNEAALLSAAASTNIYIDRDVDKDQYNTILSNIKGLVTAGTVNQSAADKAAKIVAGLGNEGKIREGATGYDPLPTTKAEIESEVTRAKNVIENRKAAGLDTTLQENYLKAIGG